MEDNSARYEDYFSHLRRISLKGRFYKRYVSSPVLYFRARRFGSRVMEVGSGTASGLLGAFPTRVHGVEINPHAVAYCKAAGLSVDLIRDDGVFPVADAAYDVCVLDNVLEHIKDPLTTLDECHRVTGPKGGLVIAVPGTRGYQSDSDHLKFYGSEELRQLDARWELMDMFSTPFGFISEALSSTVKQYCLVATYQKVL